MREVARRPDLAELGGLVGGEQRLLDLFRDRRGDLLRRNERGSNRLQGGNDVGDESHSGTEHGAKSSRTWRVLQAPS